MSFNKKRVSLFKLLSYVGKLTRFLLIPILIVCLLWHTAAESDYNWQWYRVVKYIYLFTEKGLVPGLLLQGLAVTLKLSLVALVLSCALGFATALFRLSSSFSLRALARIYLELIRNTPLIVQLFFIYFVLSPFVGIDRFTAAVIALTLFEGAYASEIIRAGIVSVSTEQWEAASSIGLSRFRIYRHIVLPQAIPVMIPPLSGQMISLIKDSALVSTIALYDLTMEGQIIISETYMVFEIWFTIAGMYLVMTAGLSVFTRILEKKFAKSKTV